MSIATFPFPMIVTSLTVDRSTALFESQSGLPLYQSTNSRDVRMTPFECPCSSPSTLSLTSSEVPYANTMEWKFCLSSLTLISFPISTFV
ncbi:hypothetical protein WICPIJ_001899 [Wickerhamomyces pijperi]|uniref:Uncharacterized protein n=1 Tax=Wickerhamomyces pijperi TaxID=599730 RepID=A0A9P8QAQ2_WICPI|nr:hypothetical protein WICPIJ_001899 [Wickerhamomyces pijperi]